MKLCSVLMSFILLVGCASVANVVKSPQGSGKIAFYNNGYDEVWGAAYTTVQKLQLRFVAADKDEGKLVARGATAATAGDNVTVFIVAVDKGSTTAEVIFDRERNNAQQPIDWSDRILTEIRASLK